MVNNKFDENVSVASCLLRFDFYYIYYLSKFITLTARLLKCALIVDSCANCILFCRIFLILFLHQNTLFIVLFKGIELFSLAYFKTLLRSW